MVYFSDCYTEPGILLYFVINRTYGNQIFFFFLSIFQIVIQSLESYFTLLKTELMETRSDFEESSLEI